MNGSRVTAMPDSFVTTAPPGCGARDVCAWVVLGVLTSAIAFLGAAFGYSHVKPIDPARHSVWVPVAPRESGVLGALCNIDGQNYNRIVRTGYRYVPRTPSDVAFFPAYPLASRWLSRAAHIPTLIAQVAVSNTCCVMCFVAAGCYLRLRLGCTPTQSPSVSAPRAVETFSLLAMGLVPTTFFFRMGYTESMFLLLCICVLYGISRCWPAAAVAILCGTATAVRPVGVCLLPPLLCYIWSRSKGAVDAWRRIAWCLPLSMWGMAGYMVFQYLEFRQPLGFVLAQHYFRTRPFSSILGEKVLSLLAGEPIYNTYMQGSTGYWRTLEWSSSPLFNLTFANPIYFVATGALVVIGIKRRWLTRYEILMAVPLVLVPYLTRGFEMQMMAQGRFMAVVFPAYLVLGNLLARARLEIAIAILGLFALMMGIYASLFAAGHPLL